MSNTANLNPRVRSQGEVAAFFGVSERSVALWVNGGAPREQDGHRHVYDLALIGRWLYQRNGDGENTIGEAKLRKTQAEAQLTELKVERETGAVITVVEHSQRVSAVLMLLRDQLRHFSDAAAEDFPTDPEAAVKLDRRVNDLFKTLAKIAESAEPEAARA